MPLDSAAIWGKDVADAIKAIGVTAGTPVTDAQLEAMWAAIKGEDREQLTTKMEATGVTNVAGGSSAGPHPTTISAGGHT